MAQQAVEVEGLAVMGKSYAELQVVLATCD